MGARQLARCGLAAGSVVICGFVALGLQQDPGGSVDVSPSLVEQHVESGELAYGLTERAEIEEIFGPPQQSTENVDGGMVVLTLEYRGMQVVLAKMKSDHTPFVLRGVAVNGEQVDIGRDAVMRLRSHRDLGKLDRFRGAQKVSL